MLLDAQVFHTLQEVLRKMYIAYAFEETKEKLIGKKLITAKFSGSQISRYNTRFEKKDMHEDVFLKLLKDFDLVPGVIKYVHAAS